MTFVVWSVTLLVICAQSVLCQMVLQCTVTSCVLKASNLFIIFWNFIVLNWGYAVAHLVEALYYKLVGHGV